RLSTSPRMRPAADASPPRWRRLIAESPDDMLRVVARIAGTVRLARDERATVTTYDVVVIGGGITGLGIARLAARNGFGVALVEPADLASGASSASSHMLHGGLRYLEHGDFALVSEALRERAAVSRMAPALARPTRFLIPFYRGDRRPPWMVRLGLFAYDAF